MTTASDLIAIEERYGAHNYHPLDVVISRAEGCWVWDVEGRRYMDCLAAYSAVNQGHCHPRLVKALVGQACRVALTSRAFRNDQLGPFCQEICELTGYQRMLPMNSGAEAVETAIKAARKWGYTVKGIPDEPGRDPGIRRQLPRPHHDHRRLLRRPASTGSASAPSPPASRSCPTATSRRSRRR